MFLPVLPSMLSFTITIVAPAAVANAVDDALQPFHTRITELPLKPEKIMDAIRAAKVGM